MCRTDRVISFRVPFARLLYMDGLINDLRFYVAFNSTSIISEQLVMLKGCVQWNPVYC